MFKSLQTALRKDKRRIFKPRPPLDEVPDVSRNTFLFLGGAHRSGTSILHRLLREHSQTSGFYQTGVPENEGQHLQTVFNIAKAHGGPGHFAFDPNSHLGEDSELATEENREQLLKEWGPYYNLSKKVLLEKSPPNIVRSRFFQQLLPNSKFVFIVRHPIAVSLATKKWSQTSPTELMLHWYVAHRKMVKDVQHLRHSMVFRYEDFVARPQFYLDEICRFAGIDEFVPKEQVKDHNQKYFSRWNKRFCRDERLIGELFPDLPAFMNKMGYTMTEPYVCCDATPPFLYDTVMRSGAVTH